MVVLYSKWSFGDPKKSQVERIGHAPGASDQLCVTILPALHEVLLQLSSFSFRASRKSQPILGWNEIR
jgi:hypothetical protein